MVPGSDGADGGTRYIAFLMDAIESGAGVTAGCAVALAVASVRATRLLVAANRPLMRRGRHAAPARCGVEDRPGCNGWRGGRNMVGMQAGGAVSQAYPKRDLLAPRSGSKQQPPTHIATVRQPARM